MHGQISTFLFSPFICVEFVYLLRATLFLPTYVETDNRTNEIKPYEGISTRKTAFVITVIFTPLHRIFFEISSTTEKLNRAVSCKMIHR